MPTSYSITVREGNRETRSKPSNLDCALVINPGRSSAPSSNPLGVTTQDGSTQATAPPDSGFLLNKYLAAPWSCQSEPNQRDLADSKSVTADAGNFAVVREPSGIPDPQGLCYQPNSCDSKAWDSDERLLFGPRPWFPRPKETQWEPTPVCYPGSWLLPETDDSDASDGKGNAFYSLGSRRCIGLDGPTSPLNQKQTEPKTDNNERQTQISTIPKRHSESSRASRSGNWKTKWFKRKPRRGQDVSEATYPVVTLDNSNSEDDLNSSCLNLIEHDARFHSLHSDVLRSCPELHKTTDHAPEISSAETRLYPQFDQSSRCANSRHHRHLKNPVFRPFHSLGKFMRRQPASPSQFIPSDHLTPQSTREQLQPRDSVNMRPLPGEETLIFDTPEPTTRPTDASVKPQLSEIDSDGSVSGFVCDLSEPSLVQQDVSSGINSPRGTDMGPQRDLPALASKTTPCQPEDVTFEPGPSPTPLQRGLKGKAVVRSPLSEVTTPADPPSVGPELKIQLIPECSGKRSPVNEIARTLDNVNHPLIPQPLTVARSCSNSKPNPGGWALDNSREVKEQSTGLDDQPPKPERLCHPDTWYLSQGEPGDSDPFCPPTCESKYSHEAATLASTPKSEDQQGSSETRRRSSSVESGDSRTDCYFDCVSHGNG